METDIETQVVAELILRDFEGYRLPRAIDLKQQVDAGEQLTESDIEFLEDMLRDIERSADLLELRPDLQVMRNCAAHLYDEIITQALQGERRLP
jgi:hypothetical protein